jgi:gliding motility-associated-like protein
MAEIEVTELIFPNIFTPNGDGKNDLFVIKNLEKITPNHVVIFNRWGKKVFSKDNYMNDWTGEDYADGVYYYIATYPENKEYHGTVNIMR